MRSKPALLFVAVAAAALVTGCAGDAKPDIEAEGGWARPAPAGGGTAAYLTIANRGGADRLIGVRARFGEASLHVSTFEDGVARMRAVDPAVGLTVPSNGKLALAPNGAHVMLGKLKRPLAAGDRVTLTLDFARTRDRNVEIRIREGAAGHAGGVH